MFSRFWWLQKVVFAPLQCRNMTKSTDQEVVDWLFEWTSFSSRISWFWWLRLQTAFSEKCYFLGITMQNCFACGSKERNFDLVSIIGKMCLLKEVDMNVGSQKSIAEKFGISISVLSWNSKLYKVLKASNIKEFR